MDDVEIHRVVDAPSKYLDPRGWLLVPLSASSGGSASAQSGSNSRVKFAAAATSIFEFGLLGKEDFRPNRQIHISDRQMILFVKSG